EFRRVLFRSVRRRARAFQSRDQRLRAVSLTGWQGNFKAWGRAALRRRHGTTRTRLPRLAGTEAVRWASSVRSAMACAIASFSNSYARLPEHFFARLDPTPVAKRGQIVLNRPLAQELAPDIDGVDAGAPAERCTR